MCRASQWYPVKADVFSVRHPKPDISLLTKLCTEVIMHVLMKIHIKYWCIDGKYRIYVARVIFFLLLIWLTFFFANFIAG
jgi:hypothetical protein